MHKVFSTVIVLAMKLTLTPNAFLLGPLIGAGGYPSRMLDDQCSYDQVHNEIVTDVLQLLSAEYGVHPLGLIPAYAAQSCDQILEANPDSSSGLYWITSEQQGMLQIGCQF